MGNEIKPVAWMCVEKGGKICDATNNSRSRDSYALCGRDIINIYDQSTIDRLTAERDALNQEVEHLRVQLSACGVIGLCNTRESLIQQIPDKGVHGWSPSLVEVWGAVTREIHHRERADKAEAQLAEYKADAERWRICRDPKHPTDGESQPIIWLEGRGNAWVASEWLTGEFADEAADAAIVAARKGC